MNKAQITIYSTSTTPTAGTINWAREQIQKKLDDGQGPVQCPCCGHAVGVLADRAATRTSDPETSREAAKSVKLRPSQEAVLNVFRVYPPMTDEELIERYGYHWNSVTPQSPSGLRSRRAELVRAGYLYNTGTKRQMTTGREAVVWAVNPFWD